MAETPYIEQESRDKIDPGITLILSAFGDTPLTPGELNYAITRLVDLWHEHTYSGINEAIGVLECVKQEFYRRVAAPYEDKKKEMNGDVYVPT